MLNDFVAHAGRALIGASAAPLKSNGSFVAAIQQARVGPDAGFPIIAEIKRASPSQGPLLQGESGPYLEAVLRGGACAISAVTAEGKFGGSIRLLRDAHATGLPTLMKDFITTTHQLDLAAANGASAVLLIERVTPGAAREELILEAHARGLEVLLEVHSRTEAAAVQSSSADIIGVNSRDLETLEVDLLGALQIIRECPTRPHLLLSGVHGPREVELARAAGAIGALVGTSLVRARDPATALRALRRSIVKVCGNHTSADVAAAHGADLIGVVVGTATPRNVELDAAVLLLRQAEQQGAASVAVTRETDVSRLATLARQLRPTFMQIHGDISGQTVAEIQNQGVGVLHAISSGRQPERGCEGTVTDSTAQGGSGLRHDAIVPDLPGIHLVAGGLDGSNVAQAMQSSSATGADASSHLESNGRKDVAKVQASIQAAKRAPRRIHGA